MPNTTLVRLRPDFDQLFSDATLRLAQVECDVFVVGRRGEGASAAPAATETQPTRAALAAEARKVIGVDLKNSCDQVAHFLDAGNEAQAVEAFQLLSERFEKGSKALTAATAAEASK